MRVLLDECVDSRLALQLEEFEVRTAAEMGWAGITNGELLKLAEASFDVFVTADVRHRSEPPQVEGTSRAPRQ